MTTLAACVVSGQQQSRASWRWGAATLPITLRASWSACNAAGRVVRSPAQLQGFPSADLQLGVGAGLDSISYFTIDASTGGGDRRQALVFVDDPRAPLGGAPMPEPEELLRKARDGQARMRAWSSCSP